MGNAATAIGNMLVAANGAALAAGPRTSATAGKNAKRMFADAAPLARLRDEVRSHNKPAPQSAWHDGSKSDATKDSVDLPARKEDPKRAVTDKDAEPVKDETALPTDAGAAGEAPIPADMAPLTSAGAESIDVVPAGEVEAIDGAASGMAAEVAMVSQGQELHAATKAISTDGQMLNQAQVSATVETQDGQSRSVEVQMNASVTGQGVQTSGKIVMQEQAASQDAGVQGPSSAATLNAEEAKAVAADASAVATRQQSVQTAGAESKVASQSGEMAETVKSVTGAAETVAKSQTQAPADGQPVADASKNSDPAAMQVAARASQSSDAAEDMMRQEDAQASSQQDRGTRTQNSAQPAAVTESAEKAPVAAVKEGPQPQIEMTAVSDNHSAEVAPRISAQVTSAAGLDAAGTRSPVQDIGDQILNSVHASMARADKQVQIRLAPPELGTVTVRLSEQGDQIRGFLEVGRDETRREIEQALPQVLKGLQEAGVQIRRLEVVVSDQGDRSPGRDQLHQDDGAQQQQQQPDPQGYRPSHPSAMNWSASGSFRQSRSAEGGPDALSGQMTQGRIDMLV